MIGKLKGKLVEVDGNTGLIETSGGVFYQVFLPPSLLPSSIINHPSSIEIYTYLQVRDDALVLFGFGTKQQHDFFLLLLTVSGVGPKTAFTVISALKTEEIIQAVTSNEVDVLTKVPGLGRKTAMKIILELSTKFKSGFDMKNMVLSDDDQTVISALVSLGYKSYDAKKIVSKLPKNLTVEEKIKEALKKNFDK
ncbi:MAG: Holliday junction branch migration protein RuvA [Candidatus Roizmanbacteria bacterium]|nr:Holliday junction branch migration protein RuvA [Candidatus Roizmanbacteria bacterium]